MGVSVGFGLRLRLGSVYGLEVGLGLWGREGVGEKGLGLRLDRVLVGLGSSTRRGNSG